MPWYSGVHARQVQAVAQEAFQSESKHRLKLRTIYLLAASMGASRISTASGRRGRRHRGLRQGAWHIHSFAGDLAFTL